MKKKLFALAIAAIILAGAVTGTVAYYTAKTVAHNVITTGEIDIELVEKQDLDNNPATPETDYPTDPVSGIMPGQDHSKIVRVANTGSNPAWVRIKLIKSVKVGDSELSPDVLTLDLNTSDWIEEGGYYYYKNIVAPGGQTAPLFRTVHFAGAEMDNDYQNARIEINVQAFATQVANNGDTVLEAEGWPQDNILTALLG